MDLLNEAKSTITQLQEEIQLLTSENDKLSQINFEYENEISFLKNELKQVILNDQSHLPPLPLEPIVIVQQNKSQSSYVEDSKAKDKHILVKEEIYSNVHPSQNIQTSQSDNTFIM